MPKKKALEERLALLEEAQQKEYTITSLSNELLEHIASLVVDRTIARLDELIKATQDEEDKTT